MRLSSRMVLAAAKEMKSKNLGLLALWAQGAQQGEGELYCIPKNSDKFRSGYKPSGMQMEEGRGLFLKRTDKTGVPVKILETIAEEGINILAIHALVVGDKYGSFIRVASTDVVRTAKALGANWIPECPSIDVLFRKGWVGLIDQCQRTATRENSHR